MLFYFIPYYGYVPSQFDFYRHMFMYPPFYSAYRGWNNTLNINQYPYYYYPTNFYEWNKQDQVGNTYKSISKYEPLCECKFLKDLPTILEKYEEARLKENWSQIKKLEKEKYEFYEGLKEHIGNNRSNSLPGDHPYITNLINSVQKNQPYSIYQKIFLADLINYCSIISRFLQNNVPSERKKEEWQKVIDEIAFILDNVLIIPDNVKQYMAQKLYKMFM